jgi:hypothetical protein
MPRRFRGARPSSERKELFVRRKLALATTVGVLVALVVVVAGCGGGDPEGVASLPDTTGETTTDSESTTPSQQDPEEAALEFAQCMREHGVDMPDPSPNGGITLNARPGDEQKIQEAQEACAPLLEDARPQLTEEQRIAMQEGFLAFARCMREHGIDFPDPQFGEGGTFMQRFRGGQGGPGPDDPEFQEAQEACQPILEEARREAGLPEGGPGFRRSGGSS